jgi:hypothetical protein
MSSILYFLLAVIAFFLLLQGFIRFTATLPAAPAGA